MSRSVKLTREGKDETFALNEVEDWVEVALRVRELVRPGCVITLSGPLGAGKTTFVQVLARELGIASIPQSPTFALLRSYRLVTPVQGIKRLVHVDAYRIEDEADLLPLDLDAELSDGKSILVIEWPEKIERWVGRQTCVIAFSISI